MSSGYSPRWIRFLHRWTPWLFWVCPDRNYHWRWDARICACRMGEHSGDWHGGLWVDGKEYVPLPTPPEDKP